MDNATAFTRLPLRKRKHARTKIGLLRATLAELDSRPLDEITVAELCVAVGISEATFFNYFAGKTSLLVYYVQLWSIEMGWHAARLARSGGLAAIEEIFALTAREIARRPGTMAEIIAWEARSSEPAQFHEIGLAERLLAFPHLAGVEHVAAKGLDELLPPLVDRALSSGELPSGLDPAVVLTALASVFFGAPVVLRRSEPGLVESAFRTQLQLLWAGLRAGEQADS